MGTPALVPVELNPDQRSGPVVAGTTLGTMGTNAGITGGVGLMLSGTGWTLPTAIDDDEAPLDSAHFCAYQGLRVWHPNGIRTRAATLRGWRSGQVHTLSVPAARWC